MPPSVAVESPAQFFVLLRIERGRIGRVRALSPGCAIDAGGLPFLWLTGIGARDSLNLLASLVRRFEDERNREEPAEQAFAAIALHADPAADSLLEDLAGRTRPLEIRKKAAFWLGNERGRRGYEILRKLLDDPDAAFRHHLTFCLSQSPVPEAQGTLIRMAHRDLDGEVRGRGAAGEDGEGHPGAARGAAVEPAEERERGRGGGGRDDAEVDSRRPGKRPRGRSRTRSGTTPRKTSRKRRSSPSLSFRDPRRSRS